MYVFDLKSLFKHTYLYSFMDVPKRIKLFAIKFYGTQKNFCDEIDENPLNFYRYTKGTCLPGFEKLIKFHKAGMSIDWLMSGRGAYFARNTRGFELQGIYEKEFSPDTIKPYRRITNWILDHYGSIKFFSLLTNVDYRELHEILIKGYATPTEFIITVIRSGCNPDWISTGESTMYANNPNGILLKHDKYHFLKELDILEKEENKQMEKKKR
jgi:hypothetical protein